MRNPYFPFHSLGFRCNPFQVLTDEEWAEVAVLPEEVLEVVESSIHLQLLGERGRGKSSTLRALAARLTQDGRRVAYEYLPPEESRFHTDVRGLNCFLLDEVQRLTARERRRLVRTARGAGVRLLLASHEDLTPLFQTEGASLATVHLDTGSETHLRMVLERRLSSFALGDRAYVSLTPDAVGFLWERFGSDLRASERALYEVFQHLEAPEPLTAERLRQALEGVTTSTSA